MPFQRRGSSRVVPADRHFGMRVPRGQNAEENGRQQPSNAEGNRALPLSKPKKIGRVTRRAEEKMADRFAEGASARLARGSVDNLGTRGPARDP